MNKILLFREQFLQKFKDFFRSTVFDEEGVLEAPNYLNHFLKKIQNASILMIPTAFNSGKLFVQEPTNRNEDFSVIRNSTVPRMNQDGNWEEVPVNTPCIDYSTGEPLLLTQPQSTNLEIQSESFEGYGGNNKVVTDNATTSPRGTISGAILADDNSGGADTVQLIANYTVNTSSTYTYSIFAKKKDLDFLALRLSNFTTPTNQTSYFDLNLGVVFSEGAGQTAKIKNYGNGWFRCSITFITDSVDNFGAVLVRLSQNGGNTIVDSDNTSNIYIWGAQFEEQPFATSYIPTNGSVATRLKDEILNAGSTDTINSEEGVLYIEIEGFENDATFRAISINNGTTSELVQIFLDPLGTIYGSVRSNASTSAEISYNGLSQGVINKIALVYSEDNFSLWVNEVQVGTDNNGATPIGLDRVSFDNTSNDRFKGKTKELRVYKSIAEAQIDLPYIN